MEKVLRSPYEELSNHHFLVDATGFNRISFLTGKVN